MFFRLLERDRTISLDFENPNVCCSILYYHSWVQTKRFYAKTVSFSP